MKIKILAALAVLALGFGAKGFGGEPPTWTAWYDFWVSATGRYPLEYFVDAHDNDGDLVRLYGQGWDESNFMWWTCDQWGGNNTDQYMHGWACSIDGYTTVRYAFEDSEGATFWEGEAPEWSHEPAQYIRH